MLSQCVNSFPLIEQIQSLKQVNGPWSGSDRLDLEASGGTSGHHTAFRYIAHATFHMPHDAIANNALYELGSNKSKLKKLQVHANHEALPMMFARWSNTNGSELGVEGHQEVGPVVLDLENENTARSNKPVI